MLTTRSWNIIWGPDFVAAKKIKRAARDGHFKGVSQTQSATKSKQSNKQTTTGERPDRYFGQQHVNNLDPCELFDPCETNDISPILYCSEVIPDLNGTEISALEETTIDKIRSHDSSSVSSTYLSKLSSMAWKSDTQWRTHRSSSSKATPDWYTQERTGPYSSYRDYGDNQKPLGREKNQSDW
jgi:hypothetical protein